LILEQNRHTYYTGEEVGLLDGVIIGGPNTGTGLEVGRKEGDARGPEKGATEGNEKGNAMIGKEGTGA